MNDQAVDAFDRALEQVVAGAPGDEVGRDSEAVGDDLAAMVAVSGALRAHRPAMSADVRARQRARLVTAAHARAGTKEPPVARFAYGFVGLASAAVLLIVLLNPFVAPRILDNRTSAPRSAGISTSVATAASQSTSVVRVRQPAIASVRPVTDPELAAQVTPPPVTSAPPPVSLLAVLPPMSSSPTPAPTAMPTAPPTVEGHREEPPANNATDQPSATATPYAATATPGESPPATPPAICGSGVITGTVRDRLGHRVIGAVVTATLVDDGADPWRTATLGDGSYRLLDLCPGTYTVSASVSGAVTLSGFYDLDGDGVADTINLTTVDHAGLSADIVVADLVPPAR